jgi:2,4-dienoyl-CoA reductase-like NADH-dependent reductase (Old Yellow Enzyme family)
MLGAEDIRVGEGPIGGNTAQDGIEIARGIGPLLDFISVSRGGKFDDAAIPKPGETAYPYTGHSGHACIPRKKTDPPMINVFLASGIRAALRQDGCTTPVITAGKIVHFEQAESILQAQHADFIGMARALLADPDLPRKWQSGRDSEQRVCVFCPFCEEEDHHHRVVTCTLWPKVPGGGARARRLPEKWG